MRILVCDLATFIQNCAAVLCVDTGDDLGNRALSGTIGAKQTGDSTGLTGQIAIAQSDDAAKQLFDGCCC